MDLPKIISVDDHVVEPPHVWQTWLPEKHRAQGPRVLRDRFAPFVHMPGARYTNDIDPDGELGDYWMYEDRLIYVHKKFVAIPREAISEGPDGHQGVRPDPHADGPVDLRRHDPGLLRPRRPGQGLPRQLDRRLAPLPHLPAVLRTDVHGRQRQGPRARLRRGLQQLDDRGVVRALPGRQHPALHHPALGRRPVRRRGRAHRRQRRARDLLLGDPVDARAPARSTPASGTSCSRSATSAR